MTLRFEDESEDGLSKDVWRFWVDGTKVHLDCYATFHRETRRHKWLIVTGWWRIASDARNSTAKLVPKPLLSVEMRSRVTQEIVQQLEFK